MNILLHYIIFALALTKHYFLSMKVFPFFVLMLTFFACGVSKDDFRVLKNENKALLTELTSLKSQLNANSNKIEQLAKNNENLTKEKESLSSDISNLEENFSSTKAKVEAVEFNLREKQYQINQLWNELDGAFSDVENAVNQSNERIKSLEEFLYLDLSEEITFGPGSDIVDPEDEDQLQKLAEMLKKNPKITMMIEGHTDKENLDKSSDEYRDNWDLSVSRATQIIRKMEEMGVNPEQLIAAGRADHMPKSLDGNPADDRRAEFIVVPNVGKLYRLHKKQEDKVIKP